MRVRIPLIKLTAFFLLVSGWFIVLAAIAMLRSSAGFVIAGVAIEILGLALLFRAHLGGVRE